MDDLGKIFKLSRRGGETDDEFRARIRAFWPGYSGGGTIYAIKSAIAKVTGFDEDDVEVIEDFSISNEKHFYINTNDIYRLNEPEVKDNVNLIVTGTAGGGAYTFINGADYILEDSYIKFGQGGTDPDNNTIFNVAYDYFDEMRYRIKIPILPTSTLFDTIRELIPDIKAAGTEPIIIWLLTGGPLNENVTVSDSVTIEVTSDTWFIIDVSLIDGEAVIS